MTTVKGSVCGLAPERVPSEPSDRQWIWRNGDTLPDVSNRPGRCFIRVEGWKAHNGTTWRRVYCASACTSSETHWDFRQRDIDRILADGDMDGIDVITHWMPGVFPSVDV